MSRLLIAVLSLSVLGYLAYRSLYGRAAVESPQVPTERLQNVKDAAKRIEAQGEQRVKDIDTKSPE
jgi:hypothetical protein